MTAPFLAEIRIMPITYAPRGWAFCQGQLMPINQFTALFSLLGVTYGGDGRSSFGLPNLQGNVPVGVGQGPGLSRYDLGQAAGTTTVTIDTNSMARHTHPLAADDGTANGSSPSARYYAKGDWNDTGTNRVVSSYNQVTPDTTMRIDAIANTGGGQGHNNMMPYLALNFCICLQGIFPQRP